MNFQINSTSDLKLTLSLIKQYIKNNISDTILMNELLILVSEIIYNIRKFSQEGTVDISIKEDYFFIKAKDNGKGFAKKTEQSILEGYSTANSLGLGLPSIIRICDELEIITSNTGTYIECGKKLKC